MSTDPIPYDAISFPNSERPIVEYDSSRIERIFALKFFKSQAWMSRVLSEEPICALCVALNVLG